MGLFTRRSKASSEGVRSDSDGDLPPPSTPVLTAERIPPPPPPTPVAPPPQPPKDELRTTLETLYQQRLSREAFAAEALARMAERALTPHGALFTYDPRDERLTLAASQGLDADAVKALDGSSAWDIPRRSVQSRRIHVIESAHQNPFVPRPIVAIHPESLSVAVMPFFHGEAPIGALALFASKARGFPDQTLHAVSQGLRICALALSKLPAASGSPAAAPKTPAGEPPAVLKGLATMKGELARLSQALDEAEKQRAAEAAERVTAQSFLQAERDRLNLLERDLAAARDEAARLPKIEVELSRAIAEAGVLRSTADGGAARVGALESAVRDAEARLDAGRHATAELATERDAILRELESSRQAGDARAATVTSLEAKLRDLSAESSRVTELEAAIRLSGDERSKLAADVEDAKARLAAAGAETETLRERLDHSRAEIAALGAGREIEATLRRDVASLETRQESLTATLEEVRSSLAVESRDRQAIAEERGRLEAELAAIRAELGGRVRDLESSLEEAESQQRSFEARIGELEQAIEEKDGLLATFEEGVTTLDLAEAELETDQELAIERSGGGTSEEPIELGREQEVRGPEALAAVPEIVLLDAAGNDSELIRHLAGSGLPISAVPLDEPVSSLSSRRLICAAVNLATPAAWRAALALRSNDERSDSPLFGYVLPLGAKAGAWLGPIDFSMLPIDNARLLLTLTAAVPRLKRVLSMSSDTDVMWSVRTQMNNANISTAVVFDGRQAVDLLPIVRPEAAILHVTPKSADVFRAVAGIRQTESSRKIPLLFLLDQAAPAGEDEFLNAGVRTLLTSGSQPIHQLAEALASAASARR